jgi:HK97 family phage major capsid protein
MLQCVRVAAITPSAIDPRLNPRAAALGANEKIGSEGGFLVGTDVSKELLEELHESETLAPMCDPVPISNDSNGITINGVDETSRANGSRFGGVQAYWADEAGTATATKPKFRKIKMTLSKLLAFYYATDEELADTSVLAALAQRAFAEEMSFKVDDSIIRGTGSGQPLGILNAPVLVSVAKETGQLAATIQFENLTKMYARMPARSKRRANWFINDDVFPQLQTMTIAAGAMNVPVYLPPGGASEAPYGTIFGRPVMPIEQCETLGTVGDIILADLSQYKLATKGGLQQASSIHVQFLTGEQVFRFVYRADGQPARSTPMTPFKGSATQSPFVVLATRA